MITGGLGYVGRYLTKTLSEKGVQVVSYNRDYSEASSEFMTAVQGESCSISPGLSEPSRNMELIASFIRRRCRILTCL
ncbi:NAD-dependent epimerase/dehydratase family protein [Pseudomonas sp. LS1212]|nr:NAD-dependent epimerase/dehydratase family protein [Pseudomonas sp. LS1212]